jgi:hypothetical protein
MVIGSWLPVRRTSTLYFAWTPYWTVPPYFHPWSWPVIPTPTATHLAADSHWGGILKCQPCLCRGRAGGITQSLACITSACEMKDFVFYSQHPLCGIYSWYSGKAVIDSPACETYSTHPLTLPERLRGHKLSAQTPSDLCDQATDKLPGSGGCYGVRHLTIFLPALFK